MHSPGETTDADGDGYAAEEGDCDDTDALTSPGALEACDGWDNDCDGEIDEEMAASAVSSVVPLVFRTLRPNRMYFLVRPERSVQVPAIAIPSVVAEPESSVQLVEAGRLMLSSES